MKHVNCPNCGCKLFDGDEGSHVILKCCKCNKLFEVTIDTSSIVVTLKNKFKESELTSDYAAAQN